MNTQKTASLITAYGVLLLICGLLHIWNSLAVNLTIIVTLVSSAACIGISYFMNKRTGWAFWGGLIFIGLLLLFFGWQSFESLQELIDKLQNDKVGSPYTKARHFLLIFTCFSSAVVVEMIQYMLAKSNSRELQG